MNFERVVVVAVPILCAKLYLELNKTKDGNALKSQLSSVYDDTLVQSTERKVIFGYLRATWFTLGSMRGVSGHFGMWNCQIAVSAGACITIGKYELTRNVPVPQSKSLAMSRCAKRVPNA